MIARSKINSCKWMNGVKWFGQNSFIAMAIHNPIKGFVVVALAAALGIEKLNVMKNTRFAIIALLITIVVTVVIMYLIVMIKQKVAISKANQKQK